MRYLLTGHGFPVGQYLIPVGTVIDVPAKAGDDWSRLATGKTIPRNAQPLDQQAFDALVKAYGPNRLVPSVFKT
jgi:hypothetical protein